MVGHSIRNKKYIIAFNSFDSRSGGHHFMTLRLLLERPEANCVLHPVQTRDALIDYFQRHKIVHRIAARIPVTNRGINFQQFALAKRNGFRLPISPCDSGFLRYCFAAGHRRHLTQTPKPASPSASPKSTLPEVAQH